MGRPGDVVFLLSYATTRNLKQVSLTSCSSIDEILFGLILIVHSFIKALDLSSLLKLYFLLFIEIVINYAQRMPVLLKRKCNKRNSIIHWISSLASSFSSSILAKTQGRTCYRTSLLWSRKSILYDIVICIPFEDCIF